MRVKIENGAVAQYPYSLKTFREENPNTSFPQKMTDELLEGYGVYRVWIEERPSYDWKTKTVDQDAQPTLDTSDHRWTVRWTVRSLTDDELTELKEQVGFRNRTVRDNLIAETDWWASSDLTMTAEQTAYRQALRDITTHANWPLLDEDSDWPTKP